MKSIRIWWKRRQRQAQPAPNLHPNCRSAAPANPIPAPTPLEAATIVHFDIPWGVFLMLPEHSRARKVDEYLQSIGATR